MASNSNRKHVPKHSSGKKRGIEKMSKGKRTTLAIVLGALIVAVVTAIVVCCSIFFYSFAFVHGDIATNLDDYRDEQSQTSIVYAYKNSDQTNPKEVTRLYGTENRVWVDLADMNGYIDKCFVALEDKRFYKHKGVDWKRTFSSATIYGASQGGSTITQQLIKNLTGDNERTFSRKFKEILKALNLERYYSKDRILEAYLNTVYLSEGCYGVETASEMYFDKKISECNVAESACIAAITQFPSQYDPLVDPEANKSRQEQCLYNMYKQGMLSKEEWEEAKNFKLKFNTKGIKNSNNATGTYSYYTDTLINQVINDLMAKYGYTQSEATHMLYYGGLRIYSAVDLSVQKNIDKIYKNRNNFVDGIVQSAMTVMDYEGRVVGIVGGVGKKTGMRGLNRASDSPRQPGSTIKPLSVYGPGIDTGAINWSSSFEDSPSLTVDGKPWPKNQSNSGTYSYYTVQRGLADSLNTISARCLTEVGLETSFDYAKNKFMLNHLTEEDVNYSSLAVGGTRYGVTTLEMAAAYAAFGNGGTYYQPWFYYNVTDSEGNVILDRSNYDNHQAIDESSAEIMNRLLQTVMTQGTGTWYNVNGQTCFGKTGTTSDDHDRWFCGGTPYYVAAVWYGYDIQREISNYGTNPSGRLFKLVMDPVHAGLEKKAFPVATSGVKTASYCSVTGRLLSSTCGSGGLGYYRTNYLPEYCYSHSGYVRKTTKKEDVKTDDNNDDSSESSTLTSEQEETTLEQ